MSRAQILLSMVAFLAITQIAVMGGEVKLFLLAGQSNMDGCGLWNDLAPELQKTPANVKLWDNRDRKWVAIGEDTTATARDKQFGPEVAFARRLSKAYPDHEIALIKTSAGGTKLQGNWLPGQGMYERLLLNYRNALADLEKGGNKVETAGLLWMQGESDSETLEMANAYKDNLTRMLHDIREKTGEPNLPVVMGRISSSLLKKTPWNFDHARIVQQAQEDVAASDDRTFLIHTDALTTLEDNTHFDSKAQLTLGVEMAVRMLEALAQKNP